MKRAVLVIIALAGLLGMGLPAYAGNLPSTPPPPIPSGGPQGPQPATGALRQTHAGGETCVYNSAAGSPCVNEYQGNTASGAPVKVWQTGSYQTNLWDYNYLTSMCGSGLVTSTCPFTVGSGLNTQFMGDPIIQIEYGPAGNCVATSSGGSAVNGTCASPEGSGGSNGVIMVLDQHGTQYNCQYSNFCYIVNRYWSDEHLTAQQMCPNSFANGSTLYLDYAYGDCGSNYGAWFNY